MPEIDYFSDCQLCADGRRIDPLGTCAPPPPPPPTVEKCQDGTVVPSLGDCVLCTNALPYYTIGPGKTCPVVKPDLFCTNDTVNPVADPVTDCLACPDGTKIAKIKKDGTTNACPTPPVVPPLVKPGNLNTITCCDGTTAPYGGCPLSKPCWTDPMSGICATDTCPPPTTCGDGIRVADVATDCHTCPGETHSKHISKPCATDTAKVICCDGVERAPADCPATQTCPCDGLEICASSSCAIPPATTDYVCANGSGDPDCGCSRRVDRSAPVAGFPEYMSFPRFRRRYECLVPIDDRPKGIVDEKAAVQHIVEYLELDMTSLRIGLSQIFFRTDTLVELEERVEEKGAYTFTLFQAHCRRYLWKNKLKEMEIDDAAIRIIQSNIRKSNIINQWSWWKLLNKIKPLMVVRKTEAEKKEIATQLDKLKSKYELVEGERNILVDNESKLEEKVQQLASQLEVERLAAANAIEQLEQEQCEKRELQEELNDLKLHHDKLKKENEETQVELMQLTLVQRIQHSEPGANEEEGDSVYLEKYRSVCRELQLLKQQKSGEYEEELDDLRATKRNLERKVEGAEGELQDLRRTLTQLRKKMAKQGSEMNDLQLHLESQQARNFELEKKQKKFDAELNTARDETSQERLAKEQLAREKATMKSDVDMLQQELNLLKSENQQLKRERDELEQDSMASTGSVAEISSLKRVKRELESKIEELEDELDEVTIRSETLEQTKSRLELSLQTLRNSHQKEVESREEEMDQLQSTMNKKVKSLENQLEDALEEKHAAVKARRDMERQVAELQAQVGDSENERALRKQLRKTRALLNDVQAQLEYEQNASKSSNMVKTLRMQLEDAQMNEEAAHKQHRRLQNEYDELQAQNDELVQSKMELESKVQELHHEKSELSGRIEEDQDEIEEMITKQRTQLHQMNMLQKELAEAKGNLEDLQYEKEEAERKIAELNSTISSLEHDKTRNHTFDNSEFKVRELQQKLEFEQTTNRRLETQVHRLKAQMEKMEDAENESSTSRTENDTIRRMQRQIRDLRDDISEAERKEADQSKRRKAAETGLEELRAEHATLQGELKLAQKRIESLQQALDGGDDDDSIGDNDRARMVDDDDDLSDGSYIPGNYSTHSSDDLSDTTPIRKRSTHSPYTKPLTESKQLSHGYLGKLSDDESPYIQRSRASKSKSKSPSDKKRIDNGHDGDFERARRSGRSKTDETWLSRFSSDEEDRRPRKHLSNSLGRHLDAPCYDNNDNTDYGVNDDSGSKNFLYEDDEELAKIRAKYSKKKLDDNDD